jgi:hypothetical protein
MKKIKEKSTTISELESMLPLSSTFELKHHMAYLIIVKPSRIIGGNSITPSKLQELKDWVLNNNLQCFLIVAEEGDIKILELRKK